MKVKIIYFSGTGNTWYVAKAINEALIERNVSSEYLSIEEALNINDVLKSCDKLIIGYPIYGSKAPLIMEEFIKNIPEVDNAVGVSVFCTVAFASGDGSCVYKKLLENKGYKFDSGFEFKMTNNFNVPKFPRICPVGDQEKISRKNTKAKLHANNMVTSILSNKNKISGNNILGNIIGSVQRKHIDSGIRSLNSYLYCEKERCTKCRICIKICPVNNIKLKDSIVIGDKCIGCMRCFHFCKAEAINITKESLGGKYPRFRGPTKEYLPSLIKIKK